MKVKVLDKNGKKVEEIELNEEVFGVKPNDVLLAQYVRVFLANQRQGTSSTKSRSEVSGGGRKPWRQKGTGRARQGSIRSPSWRKGGVVHGPKPKSWKLKLSKKMKRAAIISALSYKQINNDIKVLNELEMKQSKTKEMTALLSKLKMPKKSLIVLDKKSDNILRSASNIKGLAVSLSDNLNAYDLLKAKDVLFSKKALLKTQEKYASK